MDPALQKFTTVSEKVVSEKEKYKLNVGEWAPGWPIWNREIVILQHIQKLEDGSVISVSSSVTSDDIPLRPNDVVRGVLKGEYMKLEPLDGGKRCKVTRFSSVDPGGWLPTAVVNMLVKQNGNSLALAKAVLDKR